MLLQERFGGYDGFDGPQSGLRRCLARVQDASIALYVYDSIRL